MKIAILSRNANCYSTRRLREAAAVRGHRVRVLDTLKFSISLMQGRPTLYFRAKQLSQYDAVIPRIGASITHFGTAVVRQFEQMGVFTANSAIGINHARDKLRALQILSRHNIGLAQTEFVRERKYILDAIERIGGAPVIIKVLEGTQGVGVILAESTKIAEAIIETLHGANQNVLIQKFVAESKGKDVRAFVVGDRVVAAMRRVAQGQEFRSNVHRGGRAEPITLDPAYEKTAVRAAQIIGLRIAGVDLLEGHEGPLVAEVNASPGLEGIENATGVDVAGAILEYVQDRVMFPDMDLRQRLTTSRGYGVGEIVVAPASELSGKTIAEAHLRESDVVVLTITRGDPVIANPKGHEQLLPADKLLCFGKLDVMKALIPPSRARRPRRFPEGPADAAAPLDTSPSMPEPLS